MNRQTQSIILMIINMVLVYIIMSFVHTNIVLGFVIAIALFLALYRLEWCLIDHKVFFKPRKIVTSSSKDRLKRHYEKIREYKNE